MKTLLSLAVLALLATPVLAGPHNPPPAPSQHQLQVQVNNAQASVDLWTQHVDTNGPGPVRDARLAKAEARLAAAEAALAAAGP